MSEFRDFLELSYGELEERNLEAKEQRDPSYRASTWTARVPALLHGDFWLTESSAIVEYLEDHFPAPAHPRLLPTEAHARARARQLMSWLRSDATAPVRAERSAEVIFYDRPLPALSAGAMAAVADTVELAARFVHAASAPLLGAWCIADAELAFFLHRLAKDPGLLPAELRAYAEAQWKRPSVAAWVAHERAPFVPYG